VKSLQHQGKEKQAEDHMKVLEKHVHIETLGKDAVELLKNVKIKLKKMKRPE
jgi:hypothetical protein